MRDCCNNSTAKDEDITYKEIVIIGNGPSGIILSFILSGNWCYHNGEPHPDEMLTARLQSVPKEKSLIEQDLDFLSQGLEGRSRNPVAVLMDSLNHPHDDQDLHNSSPRLLDWKRHPDKVIDHVVIGKGKPGGSWQQLDENVTTISVSSWMELPGLSFNEWEYRQNNGIARCSCLNNRPPKRVKIKQVANYYRDYVEQMKLLKNFRNFSYVTSVKPIKNINAYKHILSTGIKEKAQFWEVQGYDVVRKKYFTYVCRNVVLATGTGDARNTLNVPGELDNPDWVYHDLKQFQSAVIELKKSQHTVQIDPVLIVGSGLSAADAILICKQFNLDMLHVFNSYTLLDENKFPKSMYPEYHQVYNMMKNNEEPENYKPMLKHTVAELCSSIKGAKRVRIISPNGQEWWSKVSLVGVMVGYRPKLNFLSPEFDDGKILGVKEKQPIDCKKNPILVSPWSYEVKNAPPGLYALGPLVGDNVVRLIHGGAVAIANHIHHKQRKK